MAQKRQGTGISKEIKQRNKLPSSPFYIAIGTVIDTADPLELGRVRVLCPTLNDNESIDINHLPPWVDCLSPFSGYKQSFKRGPEEVSSPGPIAYGFWNIPSKGAQVLVIAVGSNRYCLGCVSDHSYTSNTIPHGRFIGYKNTIVGPATASEGVVTFLTDNLHTEIGRAHV